MKNVNAHFQGKNKTKSDIGMNLVPEGNPPKMMVHHPQHATHDVQ